MGDEKVDYLTLDIETSPLDISDDTVVDYQIRKNFDRRFHPAFARVVAVGLLMPKEDHPTVKVGTDETKVIEFAWKIMRETSWDKLVTWNGIGFDVPFLKVRSRFLGINPDESIDTAKYRAPADTNHIDCMRLLQGGSNSIPPISLEIAARLFKIDHDRSKELTPLEITRHFEKGQYDRIEEYCSQDVRLTAEIFERISPTLELQPRATEKQVNYIMDIAERRGLDMDRAEAEKWTKERASQWIDENK